MSFISGMVTSLKNNKRVRKNALEILTENGGYSQKTELHFKKKATKSQLREIREKLKEENRKSFRKKIIVIAIVFVVAIYLIGFAKF
tara:strand:+ start:4725 stop:4985 length:261 start_codon:yes stop_codon:yes gene_type:complete